MSNNLYDILKKISLMVGYLVTFILSMTDVWGWEQGAAVAATISALGVLLGACLDVASKRYWRDIDEGSDDDGDAE